MNIFALFISLFYPLCGTQGGTGITPPGVVDFPNLHLQGHSKFLAGPPGYFQHPDQDIPVYNTDPANLYAEVLATGQALPRTFVLDTQSQDLQAAYVVRTRYGNFPDIIEIAVIPEPGTKSGLLIYSRSIYGAGDYGKNRAHVSAWLNVLNTKVPH